MRCGRAVVSVDCMHKLKDYSIIYKYIYKPKPVCLKQNNADLNFTPTHFIGNALMVSVLLVKALLNSGLYYSIRKIMRNIGLTSDRSLWVIKVGRCR